MPMFKDDDHVRINDCIIVWDAITQPDVANRDGKTVTKWSLKLVIPPNHPDIGLFNQLATRKLQESEFRGVLPNGGTMPVGTAGPSEFNGIYPGWSVMNAGTYRGIPDIQDENGAPIDQMQLSSLIYSGQRVDVIVHCYVNNGKVKGVAAGLDAFCIVVSANAQRQNFGSAGVNTAGAFGGGGGQQQQAPQQQQGGYQDPNQQQAPQQNFQQQAPQQQQGGYQDPNQQNFQQQAPQQQQGGGYQDPNQQNGGGGQQNFQQQAPQQQAPQQQQGGGYQDPNQQNVNQNQQNVNQNQQNVNQNQSNGQVQQAHNFMPQQ